ncbi:MAG: FAD-binding protein [Caldilineaceae bacterium]
MFFDSQTVKTITVDELRRNVEGSVVAADEPTYNTMRQAWNLAYNQYPALIVVAECTADVAAALRYAEQEKMQVAVMGTGHGVVRAADGAMLINTSRMNGVQVDPATQTAWVEAGAQWAVVLDKAQAHGLAPLMGSSSDVGAVGYTLGGGLGWLARKYGLSADSVNFFEVVTADGQVRHASPTENPDLFWGLRGGGGAFAVVTGMEIKLYPVTQVYAGNLLYPVSQGKEVFTRYRQWIKTLPNEMTTSIVIMNFPSMPELPEFLRGKSFVMVRGCYTGDLEEGEKLIHPWLEWQQPVVNFFGAIPFSQADTISNDPKEPMPTYISGGWMRELNDEVIDTLLNYGISNYGSSPLTVVEVRHAGGQVTRLSHNSPIGHRQMEHVLCVVAAIPTPQMAEQVKQYVQTMKQELAPVMEGVYLNFLEGEEIRKRTKDAYSLESYEWLMRVKAKYDPNKRFDHAFNIPASRPVRHIEPVEA